MLHEATAGCCTKDIGMSKAKRPHYCEHGSLFVYVHGLGSKAKRTGGHPALKQGKGLSASPAQQKKVRDLPCIHCHRDRHEGVEIQATHVYPRRFASCDCAGGVVPLCAEDHSLYEKKELDLLPLLLVNGYRAELVHAMVEHEASPLHVIEVVTGVVWKPVSEAVAA